MVFFIATSIIAFLLVFYSFLLAPGRVSKKMNSLFQVTKYAHRGLHSIDKSIPENSLAAFSAAVAAGYGIELDLHLTADGKIVVFHDDNLIHMCGVNKNIADCTYSELLKYRLCGTNEKIPLFSEVLALIDGRVPIIVELKASKKNIELCNEVAKLLDMYQGPYCIESFHPGIVRWFYKNRPHFVRGQLSAGCKCFNSLPFFHRLLLSSLLTNVVTRPHFVAFRHEDSIRKFRLNLFKLLGGKLVAWTVRNTSDMKYCQKFFDAVIFEFFTP